MVATARGRLKPIKNYLELRLLNPKHDTDQKDEMAKLEEIAEEVKDKGKKDEPPMEVVGKDPEYKGGYPAVIEGEKVKTEMTAEQTARVERNLKDFDLTAEDAEKLEGFKDLSYGQSLLALQNLLQLTLRDVRIGAVGTQKEEPPRLKVFGKKRGKVSRKCMTSPSMRNQLLII